MKRLFLLSTYFFIYQYGIGQQHVKLPGESLSLTINESIIKTNETLWFKVHLVTSEAFSQTLHVYLLSPLDSVIVYKTIQIIDKQGFGQITIHDTLSSGNYQLIVFTDRMKAFPNSFARSDITIINTQNGYANLSFAHTAKEPHLTFFPEGGSLIANHPTIVAVQLSGAVDMESTLIEVFIENSSHETVTHCHIGKTGIGFFSITPLYGERYLARFRVNQREYKEPMPIVREKGYGLTVLNRPATKTVKIIISQPNSATSTPQVFISQSGKIFSGFSIPKQPVSIANIPYDSIPHNGIISVDIFDSTGERLAYRKVFVPKVNIPIIRFNSLPKTVKSNEKIEIKLQVTHEGRALVGNRLSVCIIDSSLSLSPVSTDNRLFSPQTDIDLLTTPPLDWVSPAPIKTEGYILKGILKSNQKLKAFPTVTLFCRLNDTSIAEVSQADSNGHFEFRPLPLIDTTQLFLTINGKNRGNWEIEFTDNEVLNRPHYLPPQQSLTTAKQISGYKSIIDKRMKVKQLQEVTVKAKKLDPVQKQLRMNFLQEVGVGLDVPEISFDINESDPKITLYDVLKRRYPGIRKSSVFIANNMNTGGSTTVFTDGDCLSIGKFPCQLILNGRLISGECAQDMQANKVKSVELYRVSPTPGYPPIPYLSINTKYAGNYDYKKDKPTGGSFVRRGLGYSAPLSFESLQVLENSDYQSTIYWNPNVTTDTKGEAVFTFNTAKGPTTYFLKTEGITKDGQLFSNVQRITVNE